MANKFCKRKYRYTTFGDIVRAMKKNKCNSANGSFKGEKYVLVIGDVSDDVRKDINDKYTNTKSVKGVRC